MAPRKRRRPVLRVVRSGSGHGGDGGRPLCGANKRRGGGTCTQPAGWGTDHLGVGRCRFHLGDSPSHRQAGKRQMAEAIVTDEVIRLGGSLDIHPLDALLGLVKEASANVEALRQAVQRLDPSRGLISVDRQRIHESYGDYLQRLAMVREQQPEGLYGPDHQGDGKPHILVVMYDAERDRLGRYSKLCLDAGIDERRVKLQEQQGREMGRVIELVISAALAAVEARTGATIGPDLLRGILDEARDAARGAADGALRVLDAGVVS